MEHLQDLFTLWIGDSLLPADNQQTACKTQVVFCCFFLNLGLLSAVFLPSALFPRSPSFEVSHKLAEYFTTSRKTCMLSAGRQQDHAAMSMRAARK